jgi:hypothetical protein
VPIGRQTTGDGGTDEPTVAGDVYAGGGGE